MTQSIRSSPFRAFATLVTLVLSACGGGGGGSSPATTASSPPPAAPAVAPAALYAMSSGALLTNQSIQEFPLYGVAFPSAGTLALGNVAAGRRVNGDGSISVAFQTNVTTRSVHFANADITSRNLEGITARSNDVGYFEFAAADEPLNGGSLAYARAGALTFDDASLNRLIAAPFYFGFQTPATSAPMTGTASYRGGTLGYNLATFTPTLIAGDIHIETNFATNKVIGHISDLQEISTGGTSSPYSYRFVFSNVTLSRNSQDVTFSGNAKAVNMTTGDVTAVSDDSNGRSAIQGRLFGPNAEETAGLWQFNNSAGMRLAWGAFATRTESAAHPSGALSSPLSFPGSPAQSFTLRTGATFSATFSSGTGSLSGITSLADATGSLTPGLNESITLNFAHATNSGSVTFGSGDLAVSNTHSRLGEMVTGTIGQTQLWLADRGALSYARFGYWADQSTAPSNQVFSTFHAGRESLPSQLPTSGIATYRGTGLGLVAQGTTLTRISGDTLFEANFAAGTISGNFTVRNNDAVSPASAATSLPFNTVRFDSTAVSGGALSTGSAVPLQSSASVGSGNYGGRFYGPSGEEVAGHWNVTGTSGTFQSWGAFGASR